MARNHISKDLKNVIRKAANKLTGTDRREYLAEITLEFFGGSPRKAEREMGWGRETIKKGLIELNSGQESNSNKSKRGSKRSEEKMPWLLDDIHMIIHKTYDNHSDLNPKSIRKELISVRGYSEEQIPCERTIGRILKRTGIRSNLSAQM